jgi:hypothetical protein
MTIKFKRTDSSKKINEYTPQLAEIVIDLSSKRAYFGDNDKVGGYPFDIAGLLNGIEVEEDIIYIGYDTSDQLEYYTSSNTVSLTSISSLARTLLDDTSTAAMQTTLDLVPGVDIQEYSIPLASIAGLTTAADQMIYTTDSDVYDVTNLTPLARSLLDDTSTAAMQDTLGLVIGTDVQAQDVELQAIAGLTSAENQLPYFTGSGTAALTTLTSVARTLLDDTSTAAMRQTLGIDIITEEFKSQIRFVTDTGISPAIIYIQSLYIWVKDTLVTLSDMVYDHNDLGITRVANTWYYLYVDNQGDVSGSITPPLYHRDRYFDDEQTKRCFGTVKCGDTTRFVQTYTFNDWTFIGSDEILINQQATTDLSEVILYDTTTTILPITAHKVQVYVEGSVGSKAAMALYVSPYFQCYYQGTEPPGTLTYLIDGDFSGATIRTGNTFEQVLLCGRFLMKYSGNGNSITIKHVTAYYQDL